MCLIANKSLTKKFPKQGFVTVYKVFSINYAVKYDAKGKSRYVNLQLTGPFQGGFCYKPGKQEEVEVREVLINHQEVNGGYHFCRTEKEAESLVNSSRNRLVGEFRVPSKNVKAVGTFSDTWDDYRQKPYKDHANKQVVLNTFNFPIRTYKRLYNKAVRMMKERFPNETKTMEFKPCA